MKACYILFFSIFINIFVLYHGRQYSSNNMPSKIDREKKRANFFLNKWKKFKEKFSEYFPILI
jgi:hypothetical protein